ncbi:MAG: hypothetical protein OXH52_11110 [Gammaproteobacteria bacterium]|nr:hypothetical protein [Gammaproteobacteria bacterium]
MGVRRSTPRNKPITIMAVGVAVLAQAAWLDGKIEGLEDGQAEIKERLAAMEARLGNPEDLAPAAAET